MPNPAHSLTRSSVYATLLTLCACGGSSSGNTAPKITSIPLQQTASGTSVTVDVSAYVTNKESDALTYEVVSGGGTFTGSTYANTFDTLGSYTVAVKVTDAAGKSSSASIAVKVTSASLAVYDEIENGVPSLYVFDTATKHTMRFAAGGSALTFKTALPQGQIVYEKSVGGQYDLFVWDPYDTTTTPLGADPAKNERYVTKTSDGKVVFTVANGSDSDLYLWNPASGMTRTISNTDGQVDENAVVNSADLVFYERGASGQRDVYYYDYADDVSHPVATGSTTEQIVRVLENGSVLMTRIGGGGETDLIYFKTDSGLVEIGGNTASGFADYTKTYRGVDAAGRIYFEANLGTNEDLLAWDPSNGDLRTIAHVTSPGNILFGQAAGSYASYGVDASGSGSYDTYRYSWGSNASATVANSSDSETPAYLRTTGQVYYLRYVGVSNVDLYYWNGTSASAVATAGSGAYSIVQGFDDGKIVLGYDYVAGTGSALGYYDALTSTSTPVTAANAIVATIGKASGDFVMQEGTGTSADLKYWTAAGTALTTISATASVGDIYVGKTSSGDVLFRKQDSSTNNLYFWKQSTGVVTQVTDNSATHSTANAFSATR